MTESDPLVSVVIPTYNRRNVVTDAIESVLKQTYENVEIIVVDDASDDGTEQVIGSYEDQITYIKHEQNKGGAAARNTGIACAAGQYVAFLDSDDVWHSHKIERCLKALEREGERTAAAFSSYYITYNGTTIANIKDEYSEQDDIYAELLRGNMYIITSTLMVKKSILEEVHAFDEELPSFQEYDLMVRIAKNYDTIYISEPLVAKREGAFKQISTTPQNKDRGIELFVEKHSKKILEVHNKETLESMMNVRLVRTYQMYIVSQLSRKKHLCAAQYLYKSIRLRENKRFIPIVIFLVVFLFGERRYRNLRFLYTIYNGIEGRLEFKTPS